MSVGVVVGSSKKRSGQQQQRASAAGTGGRREGGETGWADRHFGLQSGRIGKRAYATEGPQRLGAKRWRCAGFCCWICRVRYNAGCSALGLCASIRHPTHHLEARSLLLRMLRHSERTRNEYVKLRAHRPASAIRLVCQISPMSPGAGAGSKLRVQRCLPPFCHHSVAPGASSDTQLSEISCRDTHGADTLAAVHCFRGVSDAILVSQ